MSAIRPTSGRGRCPDGGLHCIAWSNARTGRGQPHAVVRYCCKRLARRVRRSRRAPPVCWKNGCSWKARVRPYSRPYAVREIGSSALCGSARSPRNAEYSDVFGGPACTTTLTSRSRRQNADQPLVVRGVEGERVEHALFRRCVSGVTDGGAARLARIRRRAAGAAQLRSSFHRNPTRY